MKYTSGPWFNTKMSSYQYRNSHCGDKTILRPSYLPNGISFTGWITTSLYWIRALAITYRQQTVSHCHSGTRGTCFMIWGNCIVLFLMIHIKSLLTVSNLIRIPIWHLHVWWWDNNKKSQEYVCGKYRYIVLRWINKNQLYKYYL